MIADTAAAALHYGVTDRTIQRWVKAGLLRNHGTTRRIRVQIYAVDKVSSRVRLTRTLAAKYHPSPDPPVGASP